jgi:tetratricopeptide (TPR) repeat protein
VTVAPTANLPSGRPPRADPACTGPTSRSRASRILLSVVAALAAIGPVPPTAVAFAEVGTQIDAVDLPALAGGKAPLFSAGSKANVLVFFRPDQERSLEALRQLAGCEKELSRGVRWVAVISGSASPADARAAASSAGVRMPVLVDERDKLYDRLGIRMYPALVITDGKGVVQAVEPYRQLDFADAVKAQVRFVLGEIDKTARDRALDPEASLLPGQDDPTKKAMRDVNMARRLVELGQYEAAVKQAQRALEQAPVPAAFPVLAMAYAKLGRCADAARMLDQAQKLAPESAEIAAARALCAGK